jgi:hypothetical protein
VCGFEGLFGAQEDMNRLQDYTAVTCAIRRVECNEGTVDESREFRRMRSLNLG